MEITLKNYEEVKKQLAEFEKRQESILKAKKKMDKLLESNENFCKDLPSNMGRLEYVTKVEIKISYKCATANYQGEESNEMELILPNDLYDYVFDKRRIDEAIEKEFAFLKNEFMEVK